MTRLADTLGRSHLNAAQKDALRGAAIIVADNVAAYLQSTQQWSLQDVRGLPNIAPPLPEMFVEFRLPKYGNVGWLFYGIDQWALDKRHHDDGPRWLIKGFLFLERHADQPQMWCQVYVNADGTLAPIPVDGGEASYRIQPTQGSIYADDYAADPYGAWLMGPIMILHIALWTLCFMHTKNVDTETVAPVAKINKRAVEKYGRELVTYKVLKIGGSRKHYEAGESGGGGHKSLHIRRGCFRTFTEDAPLMGKAVGTFWWSQTVVGRGSDRVTVKQYEVSP